MCTYFRVIHIHPLDIYILYICEHIRCSLSRVNFIAMYIYRKMIKKIESTCMFYVSVLYIKYFNIEYFSNYLFDKTKGKKKTKI